MKMDRSTEKRLQSLKLPRDLTLGGTKPKKVFVPNLNVARNKDKAKELIIKSEDKKRGNNKKDGKPNNKRTNTRTERFVQSSGIFSDGMGNDALKKIRFERMYSPRDEVKHTIAVPKIKKDDWQIDAKSEAKLYQEIVADNSQFEEEEEPLSFTPTSWNEEDFKERKVPVLTNGINKLGIKSEPNDCLELNKMKVELNKSPQPFQETDKFSDYNPGLTLWKLPDSFAGKGLSDDPNVQTVTDYKLKEMLEGQIGSMRIYQSGKVEVSIGSAKYQVEPSQLETFTEKIVALDSKSPAPTGIVLGEVTNRFTLNPDWEFLLNENV